jgi:hypothetical protein
MTVKVLGKARSSNPSRRGKKDRRWATHRACLARMRLEIQRTERSHEINAMVKVSTRGPVRAPGKRFVCADQGYQHGRLQNMSKPRAQRIIPGDGVPQW